MLESWTDGPTKSAIIDFVDRVANENSPEFVPPPDRVAREFGYTSGADKALDRAAAQGWTVVSVKNDWNAVFADAP